MKGFQKKMLLLKNTGSEIFDEAYFILKDDMPQPCPSESDMIREANRIVNENLISGYFSGCRRGGGRARVRSFVCGLVLGCVSAGLLALILR